MRRRRPPGYVRLRGRRRCRRWSLEAQPPHRRPSLRRRHEKSASSRRPLFVAIDPLAAFVALLRLDGERGDRPGVETLQVDRLARLLAIAVGAVLDSLQGRVDLADQLALAVAGAELDGAIGL